MSFKNETIDLVHEIINGKKAKDDELHAALFLPRKGPFSSIKGPILDLKKKLDK